MMKYIIAAHALDSLKDTISAIKAMQVHQ